MSHIIQNFGQWKRVNEDDVPGRERERKDGNKVVAIPIDKTTLKMKIVNDKDVIDNTGKLTPVGFNDIISWIKSQGEIINYYTALNDLVNNVVIYSVTKDNSRKQVIIFKIYSKIELKAADPNAAGINPKVQYIRQDELPLALTGTILNAAGARTNLNQTAKTDTTEFPLPFPAASIVGSIDPRVISFIVTAYNKIKKDKTIQVQPIMAKVKAEATAKKLGANSALFVKALNAGFGILDAQFKEETEVDITQALYDKINSIAESKETYLGLDGNRVYEALSLVIPGFDIDAFIAVANAAAASSADTGNIKVPANGFKEGIQNDPEFKKFQDLLAKKFARHLANHAVYQKFKKAGAKGFLGNYGPLTRDLVYLLKAIAENPTYPNRDGSTVEPEFVNLVQKVNESTRSSYLGLDGATFIFEDFNFSAATTVSPSTSLKSNSSSQQKPDDKTSTPKPVEIKNPFKTRDELIAFQKWVISDKKDKSILGKSGADGAWGNNSAAAWTKYGKDYKPKAVNPNKFSGELSAEQLKTLGRKIRSILEKNGLTKYLAGSSDSEKVRITLEGISWKIVDPNNSSQSDTFELLSNGSFKADLSLPIRTKRTITGKISTDLNSIIIKENNIALEKAVDLTVNWDTDKKQLSDSDIVRIASQLKESMKGAGADTGEFDGKMKLIKSYPDLKKVLIEFNKIAGDNLTAWIAGESEISPVTVINRLFVNGLVKRKDYYATIPSIEFIKSIFSKARSK